MTFIPFASVVSAFQSSLLEVASASSCFALSDLKVDIPAEVKVVNGQVLVELASSANKVDPSVLTRLTFSLCATCTPDAMPEVPPAVSPWAVVDTGTAKSLFGIAQYGANLWIAGDSGVVLASLDAGLSFGIDPVGSALHLQCVAVTASGAVVVAGEKGSIFVLPTGYPKWIEISPFTGEQINSLVAAASRVVAVGTKGAIFLSEDDGQTWKPVNPFTQEDLHAVWRTPDGLLFAVGAAGAAGVSKDSGMSWIGLPGLPAQNFYGGWSGEASAAHVVGEKGTIYRFSGSWNPLATKTLEHLRAIWGFTPMDVWAIGDNGTILRSQDGASFSPVDLSVTASLHALVGAGDKLVIAGADGLVGRLDVSLLDNP
jgi:hypothetical protein